MGEKHFFGRGAYIRLLLAACFGSAAVALFSGCHNDGPDLADVHGTIRLDGKPLADAMIRFVPVGGKGTYSAAITDSNGEYRVQYNLDSSGAMIGEHMVTITTDHPGKAVPGPERVPARYNLRSELTRTVTAENKINVFDFDLESGNSRNKGAGKP